MFVQSFKKTISFGISWWCFWMQYPLCTLLVFDSRQHALPVAWVITRSIAKADVAKWTKALLDRARSIEPGWKINGIVIDDAAMEIDPIRQDIFALKYVLNWVYHFLTPILTVLSGILFVFLSYFPFGVFVDLGWGMLLRNVPTLKFSRKFLSILVN